MRVRLRKVVMLAYYRSLNHSLVRERLCQFVFEDFCIEKTDVGVQ